MNKKQSQATARPWQANQSEMEAHSPLVEIRTAPNGDYKVCDCGWQNAELIVQAVNERDALLASRAELLYCLDEVLGADGDLNVMDFNRYRAAIAKAKASH